MEIEKCFKKLLIKNPFYGLFCLSLPKVITRSVPSLAVSKQGINLQLNINPDFWAQYTDDEQIALLTHELSHIALQHIFISSSFADPKFFNIAADAEVNSYIENLPQNAITADWLSQKLNISLPAGAGTKTYYEAIMKAVQQQQSQQSQSQASNSPSQPQSQPQPSSAPPEQEEPHKSNQGASEAIDDKQEEKPEEKSEQEQKQNPPSSSQQEESEPQNQESQYPDSFREAKPIDSHSSWKEFHNLPEANKQLMQNNINNILRQTADQVEKMRGTIPGELTEVINKLREKKPEVFNWKAYFRRLLGSIYDINIKTTRRKQSKRFEGNAGIQHKKKVSILVAIDTSGSVSEKELQEFFSEIDYVYKAGARITILECDTRINSITEYDGKNLPAIKGRGGTDFNPPVEYYVKHKKEYASLIYFTDGECSLPDKNPSGMVWVISSRGMHQDYPGKAIYIPKNNN